MLSHLTPRPPVRTMAPSEPKKEKKERTLTGLHVRKNLRRMASGGSSRKDEEAANEDLLRADRAEAAAAAADAWLCEARLAHGREVAARAAAVSRRPRRRLPLVVSAAARFPAPARPLGMASPRGRSSWARAACPSRPRSRLVLVARRPFGCLDLICLSQCLLLVAVPSPVVGQT